MVAIRIKISSKVLSKQDKSSWCLTYSQILLLMCIWVLFLQIESFFMNIFVIIDYIRHYKLGFNRYNCYSSIWPCHFSAATFSYINCTYIHMCMCLCLYCVCDHLNLCTRCHHLIGHVAERTVYSCHNVANIYKTQHHHFLGWGGTYRNCKCHLNDCMSQIFFIALLVLSVGRLIQISVST